MSAAMSPPSPETAFVRLAAALAAHRAGDFATAESGYRAVLAADPGDPTALRLLGLLLLSRRRPEAEQVLARAVAAAPDDAVAATALADARAADGRTDAAIAAYRAVLARHPGHHAARVNLANALRDAGDTASAIAECRLVLATAPRLPEAHITLGASLLAAGRVVEAIGAARAAVSVDPGSARARTGYALALLRDGRAIDALDAAMRATEIAPDDAEAWFLKGAASRALGRAEAAREALERALALAPGHAAARLALGNALADLGDLAGAERELEAARAVDPSLAEAAASLGCVLAEAGRPGEAVAACDAALALRPDLARAHWNRAVALLLRGDYPAGFAEYEWRRRDPLFAADFPAMTQPEWNGESLAGRTLLVVAEQGFGDAIQFARFLPLLAPFGARVVLACARPLLPLLRHLPGVDAVVPRDAPLPPHDRFVFQMSLPRLLGTTIESIPAAGGYLSAPAAPRPPGRLRVGLAWAGNPAHRNDARRSLPTAALAPLARLDIARLHIARLGIDWVNLQHGARGAELALMHRLPAPIRPADFAETAAALAGLDLVVAADTAVAHLAGALGRPVWIMLPHAPDWRWLLGREDSPWYASARLFRQDSPGDWAGVVARVAAALEARVPA